MFARYNSLFFSFLGVFLFLPPILAAIPVPILSLTDLTNESSLIVSGKVLSIQDAGKINYSWEGQSIPGYKRLVQLQAARILKGQNTTFPIAFYYVESEMPRGFGSVKLGQFGVFFLKSGSQIGLSVTSPYYPSVIAYPAAPTTKGKDIDRVAAELTNVLNSANAPLTDRVSALNALDGVNTLPIIQALKLVTQKEGANLKLRAIALLFKANDISSIDEANKILLSPPTNIDKYLIDNLASALKYIKSPAAIPQLAPLLDSTSALTRRSAAYAIRHTGSPQAIEPLKKALYNNDREIRYEAVIGLAEITGQDSWGPAVSIFNNEEQRYLTYWRDWAKKH